LDRRVHGASQILRGGRPVEEAKMQLHITGKNMNITERTESYVREKLERLDRHLSEPVEARVELATENTKNVHQRQIVQVTLYKNGTIIRAEERSADLRAAVDAVVDKLDKQIRRYKGKRERKRRAPVGLGEAVAEHTESVEPEPLIVRTKRFKTLPMSPPEAIDQMELLGHSFYLFLNQRSGEVNLVYRRSDGNYGVLEPQLD
jgi:putative sigma-54 modulation protein